ncbi:AAA family ATPase [candidate division GN15 bacterium]|uniref:AAA family ATPase n=1 Tax=candidate division GN15 bacterium TaxID=2072418 RepID=A0A855XAN2_9BACT|nr:MAG: AAA family ATPase [candidate division GN15 bacterium]
MDLFRSDKPKEAGVNEETIRPLADRIRPVNFDEFVGQEKIIGVGTPLRKAIESDKVGSLIFWGPPGSGKTTLAELIARSTHGQFVPFSAVSSSIKEIKEIISKAGAYYQATGRRTYIFVDEIHRFNKAQQDAFLPYVEKGDIVLIGATTENPSFEVNSALLSRMRVYVLTRLSPEHISKLIERALTDGKRGLGKMKLTLSDGALGFIANAADGDARRGLMLLELTAEYVGADKAISVKDLEKVHQKQILQYDKAGEEHYNLISALHKTIRGGDPDSALYWLARMLDSGEDPMYIIRRMVRFATEDIGLADPYALTLTLNARDTYHFLGSPEGELAIAEAVVYMACAPKSNSIYLAFDQAMNDASEHGSLPVPLWIRNAPTKLMKALDYGRDYKYAHEFEDAITDQEYFPDELAGTEYYHPKEVGREANLKAYLDKYKKRRRELIDAAKKPSKKPEPPK